LKLIDIRSLPAVFIIVRDHAAGMLQIFQQPPVLRATEFLAIELRYK
jgi:hypothetical protein